MSKVVIKLLLLLGIMATNNLFFPMHIHAQTLPTPLIVGVNISHQGNLATIDQPIEVYGTVNGDVTSWSGNITVAGVVTGDVVSYAGTVLVKTGGRVDGNVLAPGGGTTLETQATIAGQQFSTAQGSPILASVITLFAGERNQSEQDTWLGRALFGATIAILLLTGSVVWSALWPGRTNLAALTLRRLPTRSIITGLLSTLILSLTIPLITTILASSLIGIPIAVVILLIVQIPYIAGIATLLRMFGHDSLDSRTIFAGVGLVALIALIIALQPVLGILIGYILISPGLGAVVLSRGGLAMPYLLPQNKR
jgi:cytoskeletal protein CcmA (bactofilin family)